MSGKKRIEDLPKSQKEISITDCEEGLGISREFGISTIVIGQPNLLGLHAKENFNAIGPTDGSTYSNLLFASNNQHVEKLNI